MTALIVSLLLASVVGLALRRLDGRFRRPGAEPADPDLPVLGSVATLVQVSAAQCAVCPRVATVLRTLAATTPGVVHVELPAELHPALLARHDVRRSPTVLVVDAGGRVVARASGAITADQARTALAPLFSEESVDVRAA